jgi:quinolinate synthase
VVNTILQEAAQVPDVNIFFGPDTCMGENLVQTFEHLASLSDAEIAAIHSGHTKATIQSLLTRFNYYKQGICVVHHMFDESVTSRLQRDHMDAHLTAHFEVPGVMFDLSLEAQAQNRGKVGSTSDILNYIVEEVQATAATHPTKPVTLPFVLGTEAGMITGIVAKVQHVLQELDSKHVEAEIIFPVADSAISVVSADPTNTGADLGIVPGVTAGEGCSAGGGCATCPYMKMNNLDSLLRVVELAAY